MRGRDVALSLALCAALSRPAAADERTAIRLWNAGGQAGMTLASAAIQRKIHGWRDVWRVVAAGSASGLGLYESKALVARNRPAAGWILANVAGSVTENAAAGRHPLSQIGYTFGPLRFRVAVPKLDRDARPRIAVDLSAFQTLALAVAVSEGGAPRVRSGIIAFRRDLQDRPEAGATAGIFPLLFDGERITWLHEFTHAVQSLQVDAAEPPSPWRRMRFNQNPGPRRLIAFEHIRIGMFNFANEAYLAALPYEKHWPEIEAYRLTENMRPR